MADESDMAGDASTSLPLDALLWGKRRHPRHPVSLRASVRGLEGPVPAKIVDISAGGVLLRLAVADLSRIGRPPPGGGYFEQIEANLGSTFEVSIAAGRVLTRVRPVRLAVNAGERGHIYLGCRFLQAMAAEGFRALGIGSSAPTLEFEAGAAAPPDPEAEARALRVHLRLGENGEEGEASEGRLVGLGVRSLAVLVSPVHARALFECEPEAVLHFDLQEEGKTVWEGKATLLALRHDDLPEEGLEAFLVAQEEPPASLVERLRRTGVRDPLA